MNSGNETFKKRFKEIKHAQPARVRAGASTLRPRIESYIANARREKRELNIAQRLARRSSKATVSLLTKREKELLALPELSELKEAVDAWTSYLMRDPQLIAQLEQDPRVSEINHARGKKGKYEVSNQRPVIRKAVAVIARVPRTYYIG